MHNPFDYEYSNSIAWIISRFPDLNITSGLVIDKEAYRISAYDNVDDKRSPRAPLSEISELTEFSDPWAEVSSEVGFWWSMCIFKYLHKCTSL